MKIVWLRVLSLCCCVLLINGQKPKGKGGAAGKAPGVNKPEKVPPSPLSEGGVAVGIEQEGPFFYCRSYSKSGEVKEQKYDQCTSICCGGKVYAKKPGLKCCGSEELGSTYTEGEMDCCSWWTGTGRAYKKGKVDNHKYRCCGPHLIENARQGCCYGEGEPQPHDRLREKCCGSNKVKKAFGNSECCGDTASYDRVRQSCPCNDGQVVDARLPETKCCKGEGGKQAPYIVKTQFCCDGEVGTNGTDFCCGSSVGKFGKDVCCDGTVAAVIPADPTKKECCNNKPYNPKKQTCCDGEIKPITGKNSQCCGKVPFDPALSICCEGNVWGKKKDGNTCCGQYAFFPEKKSFCCNGVVYFSKAVSGDACCGEKFYYSEKTKSLCCNGKLIKKGKNDECCDDVAYNSNTQICCDGYAFDRTDGDVCCNGVPYFEKETTICCELGPSGFFVRPECCGGLGYDGAAGSVCCAGNIFEGYAWPSCCINQGYDASTHTCCGSTIFPNPNRSMMTRCCGELDPRPYDLFSQMCCDGAIVNVPKGSSRRNTECCGTTGAYNPSTQLCCEGKVNKRTDYYLTQCCGTGTYDTSIQVCCDGKDGTKPTVGKKSKFGETTSCCGNKIYDSKSQFCCDGILSKAKAGVNSCCGGSSYDSSKKICCDGKLSNIGKNVPWQKASCCGQSCMYEGPQFCCSDRIYSGSARSKKTCGTY